MLGKNKGPSAIELLREDHRRVEALFQQYEGLRGRDLDQRRVLEDLCHELTVHATAEEELFYPAVRAALGAGDDGLANEAAVEHAGIKTLVGQLENSDLLDEMVDARVHVLHEYVRHHVAEEEARIFPKVKKSKRIDLGLLAARLLERKRELDARGPSRRGAERLPWWSPSPRSGYRPEQRP